MANQQRLDKLNALCRDYSQQLPQRIQDIKLLWMTLSGDENKPELWQGLHRLVHGLAGSAGTFGYTQISEKARILEHHIQQLMDNHRLFLNQAHAPIEQSLDELQNLLAQELTHPLAITQVLPMQLPLSKSDTRLLFVLENDDLIAQEIVAQMSIYGWEVQTFSHSQHMSIALANELPSAILVDIMLSEQDITGTDFLIQHQQMLKAATIPTMIVSAYWDWQSRLAAARAGVAAYYVKPIDFVALAERLEDLTQYQAQEPFRVLIVEDETILAQHYAEVLTQAGMLVKTCVMLADVLACLEQFEPELLLLDLYMPHCSGTEMATVIRQDERFNDVPIVFLSTESGRHLQLTAMQSGADDFLHKPITNTELVVAVSLRAARFRSLRQLIRQDSMTGLLNHIAFKLQLEIEISRHQRTQQMMAVVMLDIDKFKQVNDVHGHPVGDRVIKSLAQLLRKRLRKTDIIGRYGGEEFAIVMTHTAAEEALQVINNIREQFAKIRHSTESAEFACTFSAGLAVFPQHQSVASLLEASDQALYQAKAQGRNRVCVSAETKKPQTFGV